MEEEQVEQGLKKLMEVLSSEDAYDDFEFLEKSFAAKEMIKTMFSKYISEVEGSACSVDKASFITQKIFQAINEKKHLSLQIANDEKIKVESEDSKLRYWCPETIEDTRQAVKLLFMLMSSFRTSVHKEKQNKELQEKLKEATEQIADYKQLMDVWDEREYRKRFLEEWRAEEQGRIKKNNESCIAGYPDGDYVYKLYFEQKAKLESGFFPEFMPGDLVYAVSQVEAYNGFIAYKAVVTSYTVGLDGKIDYDIAVSDVELGQAITKKYLYRTKQEADEAARVSNLASTSEKI